MTFPEWHKKLKDLAKEQDLLWLIPSVRDYPRDAFDDGISPEDELQEQIFEACESC